MGETPFAKSCVPRTRLTKGLVAIMGFVLAVYCLMIGTSITNPENAYASPLTTQALTTAPYWTLNQTNVTIKDYTAPTKVYVNNYDSDDLEAYSNASNVVSASIEWDSSAGKYYVELQKKGVGKAIVTVGDYYDDTSRTINVNCVPADFMVYYGNFAFQKSTGSYTTLGNWAVGQSGSDSSYYTDSYINSVVSSNPKVASVSVSKNKYNGITTSYATITPKKNGSTRITYTDQYGRSLTYTITVAKNYWKANLKARTWCWIGYGEKKITAYSKPYAKVTLKIGGEKRTKKANKNGQVKFKLKNIYKVGKKYTVTAKLGKVSAKMKNKVYKSGGCYFSGRIWSNESYMPIRVYNAHKGDYLVLSYGKEKHKKKFKKNTSSWSGTLHMKHNMRYYNYNTIKVTLYNKFKQKLSSDTWDIRF